MSHNISKRSLIITCNGPKVCVARHCPFICVYIVRQINKDYYTIFLVKGKDRFLIIMRESKQHAAWWPSIFALVLITGICVGYL